MNEPLYTIMIPSLRPSQLTECLASIECYRESIDYEVIVISPFDIEPHPNVVHMKETESEGSYKALAMGYKQAKGEYITILPDDCRATPSFMTNMVKFMRLHDNKVFEGNFRLFNNNGERPEPGYYHKLIAPFFCIRRDITEQVGGLIDCYYRSFYGDSDLSLRVWHCGGQVQTCPNAWIRHVDYSDEIHRNSYNNYFQHDREAFIKRWHHIYAPPGENFLGSIPVCYPDTRKPGLPTGWLK